MADFETVKKNLEARGYAVRVFATGKEAADYLDAAIDGKSVGFGGSATLDALGLYERLGSHNRTIWHWKWEDKDAARREAMVSDVYLTSVNGLAETGELVNIDGAGNRAAATLFGHENAKRLGRKTPCAVSGDRCYDCKSPERICRGLVTLWGPMMGMEAEVLLVEEDLGL